MKAFCRGGDKSCLEREGEQKAQGFMSHLPSVEVGCSVFLNVICGSVQLWAWDKDMRGGIERAGD